MSKPGVADADDASPIDRPAAAVPTVIAIVSLRRRTAHTFTRRRAFESDDLAKWAVASGFWDMRSRGAPGEPARHGEHGGNESGGCDTVEPEMVRRRDDGVGRQDRMRE